MTADRHTDRQTMTRATNVLCGINQKATKFLNSYTTARLRRLLLHLELVLLNETRTWFQAPKQDKLIARWRCQLFHLGFFVVVMFFVFLLLPLPRPMAHAQHNHVPIDLRPEHAPGSCQTKLLLRLSFLSLFLESSFVPLN